MIIELFDLQCKLVLVNYVSNKKVLYRDNILIQGMTPLSPVIAVS